MAHKVEKARIADAIQIHKLVNYFAEKGEMLPRPLSEIYENLRDYSVVRQDGRVIACAALHINWEDLAEIKSVAVIEEYQKQNVGEQLVAACLNEARELGISQIFCFTYTAEFFERCGFSAVDKSALPRKVWGECYSCPKFPDCDESALIYHLERKP